MQPDPDNPVPRDAKQDQEKLLQNEPLSQLPGKIPPLIERSQEAFRRDLPDLLKMKGRSRQWVAYHGDRRIGFAPTKTELYQECLRQGFQRGEFVVRSIEPEVPREAAILF
jgi:hypothetical protein